MYNWPMCEHRTEDLALSPDGHWLVASDGATSIHVYNFVTRESAWALDLKTRLTSISISQNSRHVLVNHNTGVANLVDLVLRMPVMSYTGFTGGQFMIRSTFGGADESFVISGSEGKRLWSEDVDLSLTRRIDGSINIWHKSSAQQVVKLNGHIPGCNSVSWSPTNPCLFASCGDDGKIKMCVPFPPSFFFRRVDTNLGIDGQTTTGDEPDTDTETRTVRSALALLCIPAF